MEAAERATSHDLACWEPYRFLGCEAMCVTKPYQFIRFGAMDVTRPTPAYRAPNLVVARGRFGPALARKRMSSHQELKGSRGGCLAKCFLEAWGTKAKKPTPFNDNYGFSALPPKAARPTNHNFPERFCGLGTPGLLRFDFVFMFILLVFPLTCRTHVLSGECPS